MSLTRKRILIAALLAAVVLASTTMLVGKEGVLALWALKDSVISWCRGNPWILFASMVVLPGFGFPASALLVLAGATWGTNPTSCAIAVTASALNMAWTYFAAAGPARRIVGRLLGARWDRWRDMDRRNLLKLTLLLRVTPGLPLCVQNYVLGLLAVPFSSYLLISVPINAVFVIGFVLTGGAIFEGSLGAAIAGILLLVAAIIAIRMLRGRFAVKGQTAIN